MATSTVRAWNVDDAIDKSGDPLPEFVPNVPATDDGLLWVVEIVPWRQGESRDDVSRDDVSLDISIELEETRSLVRLAEWGMVLSLSLATGYLLAVLYLAGA